MRFTKSEGRRRANAPHIFPHAAHVAAAALQVPTFQPTQGDAALGLDAALGNLSFQDTAEEAAAPEQPTELPEWACA